MEKLSGRFLIDKSTHALERLDGEFVIISFLSGKYYSVNTSGSDILSLALQGVPIDMWNEILSDAYGAKSISGVEEFIAICESEEILKRTSSSDDHFVTELPDDNKRNEWNTPTIKIFEDLSDLLLVDPIHDSSVDGWPNTRNE